MRNRRLAAAALAGTSVAAVLAGTATAATAGPSHPAAPALTCVFSYGGGAQQCTVTVSVTQDPDGTFHLSFTFTAIGNPKETFTVYVFSTAAQVGTFTADSNGTVSGSVTLPASFPAGTHTLTATGANGQTASTTFTIPGAVAPAPGGTTTPGSGSLPFTGADVAAISVVGGALVLGGGVAFAAGARRKRSSAAAV